MVAQERKNLSLKLLWLLATVEAMKGKSALTEKLDKEGQERFRDVSFPYCLQADDSDGKEDDNTIQRMIMSSLILLSLIRMAQ